MLNWGEKQCLRRTTNQHMGYYLFICFLLNSSLIIIYHQAILNVCMCWTNQGVHRLGMVTNIGLLCQCTIKGSVLLCLQGHIISELRSIFIVFSQTTECISYTCFIAISPTLSECFLMLSRKSLRSDIEISLISSLNLGRFSAIIWQNLYWLTLQTEPHKSIGCCTELIKHLSGIKLTLC